MNARFTATCTALTLAGLAVQSSALAGDREWAVAGKVLTGIAAAHVISRAIDPGPRVVYYQQAPTVVYQTVPAPTTVTYVANAPVAPAAPVYAPAPPPVYAAPTTAVVYQTAPQVVYVAAPAPVYVMAPPVYVRPYGHFFRPRHCYPRW